MNDEKFVKPQVSNDALDTLGMIHFKQEKRDAIHLAVDPVVAGTDLQVGQKIGIEDGIAWPVGETVNLQHIPYHGIVDPFLPRGPKAGESFWFVMKPRAVQSLRHVWQHPDFPEV